MNTDDDEDVEPSSYSAKEVFIRLGSLEVTGTGDDVEIKVNGKSVVPQSLRILWVYGQPWRAKVEILPCGDE